MHALFSATPRKPGSKRSRYLLSYCFFNVTRKPNTFTQRRRDAKLYTDAPTVDAGNYLVFHWTCRPARHLKGLIMKKIAYAAFILGVLLTTAPASAQTDAPTKKPCAVLLGTNVVDLGTLMKYETGTHAFHISNTGETPLKIKGVVSTCGCIKGTASTSLIPPKEEGVITVLLKASEVHNAFSRSVWVLTDDPQKQRIPLTLKGVCVPVFQGVPQSQVPLRSLDAAVVWTNDVTLTASETNTFLGAPTLTGGDFAKIDVTVKTNMADKMSYDVRTVIKPLDSAQHVAAVTFPVIGKPGTDPGTVRLQFQMQIGAELHVTPNKMLINPAGKTPSRRIAVQTSGGIINTNLLNWSPVLEGVDVSFVPVGKSGIRFNTLLTVTVSDEAARRLLKEKTELTFSYPDHKPAKLSFASIADAE